MQEKWSISGICYSCHTPVVIDTHKSPVEELWFGFLSMLLALFSCDSAFADNKHDLSSL